MIDVRDLTKAYPGVLAVDRISFTVERGQIVGFLGPNGAGKSTTMRIITCFIPPTTGTVSVQGLDVLRDSMKIRRLIGYLPESNPLYNDMRVEEYLSFRAQIKGASRADRARFVGSAMEKCGITERRSTIIDQLSKGYKQRVGMADAILAEPEIIILDEPTIGLDPNQVRTVRDLIRELGEKRTVILSTHILTEVERTCSRVLIVNRGRLVADGTPAQIINKFTVTGRVRFEIRGSGEGVKEIVERIPNVHHVTWMNKGDHQGYVVEPSNQADLRCEIAKCAAAHGWELLELGFERVSLEDAFVEVTAGPGSSSRVKEAHRIEHPEPVKIPEAGKSA